MHLYLPCAMRLAVSVVASGCRWYYLATIWERLACTGEVMLIMAAIAVIVETHRPIDLLMKDDDVLDAILEQLGD